MSHQEILRVKLQESFDKLIGLLGKVQMGSKEQLPYGWGNLNKGRIIPSVLKEIIVQNVEKNHLKIGVSKMSPSASQYNKDWLIELEGEEKSVYINFRTQEVKRKSRKKNSSDADYFSQFYDESNGTLTFASTFYFKLHDDICSLK